MTAPLTPAQLAAWRAEHSLSAHAREIADSHDRLTDTLARVRSHHAADECDDCGTEFCVGNEPLHFHHDGCPWEHTVEQERAHLLKAAAALKQSIHFSHGRWLVRDGRAFTDAIEDFAAALATPGSPEGGNDADLA